MKGGLRLLKRSVRQPDPYYAVEDGWVVRRLGPPCGRIEVAQFPKRHDERLILRDMGQETANLHLATPDQKAKVLSDLSARSATASSMPHKRWRTQQGKTGKAFDVRNSPRAPNTKAH